MSSKDVDNWCSDPMLTFWLMSAVPYITVIFLILLITVRPNLAPGIEQALVVRASSLEKQSSYIEPILMRGELYAAEVLDPVKYKPFTYNMARWGTAVITYACCCLDDAWLLLPCVVLTVAFCWLVAL